MESVARAEFEYQKEQTETSSSVKHGGGGISSFSQRYSQVMKCKSESSLRGTSPSQVSKIWCSLNNSMKIDILSEETILSGAHTKNSV